MTAEQLFKLLAKHRQSGVALDSNLLLLLWIGSFDRSLVSRFKRTQKYTEFDFDLLVELIRRIPLLVTTPSVLTEVSNLAGQLPEPLGNLFRDEMRCAIGKLDEKHIASRKAASEASFVRLGVNNLRQSRRLVSCEPPKAG
ncbi:MAG TPA: hypothetical protein VI136_19005 [Verrucomicrobiae bacterium]